MLAAGLDQAMSFCEMRFGYQRIKEQLAQSRRHTDCLVNLLWRTTPRSNEATWFPQRYMLERLSEELARTERHAIPLTMILGEVQQTGEGETSLPDWATNLIVRSKRRCDVAGQYGTNGFLLLLVHTTKEGAVNCCRRLQQVLRNSLPMNCNRPIANCKLSSAFRRSRRRGRPRRRAAAGPRSSWREPPAATLPSRSRWIRTERCLTSPV